MNNNDFAQFIDGLRESRNMTRADLVNGIISERQYYRFINGESSLKNMVILQILDRLELNDGSTFGYYKKKNDETFKRLTKIYNAILNEQLSIAHKEFNLLDTNTLHSKTNKAFYMFIEKYLQVKQNKISYNCAAEHILDMIDYPNILNKDILTFIEKSSLIYVTKYLMEKKDYRVGQYFYEIVRNESTGSSSSDHYTIPFRINAAKCLIMIEEYSKSLNIYNKTEEIFFNNKDYNPMIQLYHLKAYSENRLFEDERYKKSLQKMFSLLYLSDNDIQLQKYEDSVYKYFHLKMSDLIEYK